MTETFDGLRDVTAPKTLLPRVLTAVDLADCYLTLEIPIGTVYVAFNSTGISAVTQAPDSEEFERGFQAQFGRKVFPAEEIPAGMLDRLRDALAGKKTRLEFDLRGLSEFERAVLMKALEIPHGEIRPYAWIAREIGRPRAVRAVGTALARNPIPLFIPCHRVVRSDGLIGNYGLGGSENKRTLLRWEGADPETIERLARNRVRYVGSMHNDVFCFPTCRHAKRIDDLNRVHFRSEEEAERAGYHACKTCRPGMPARSA